MGTLYDQLTYPEQIGEGDTNLSKERLVEILSMVDLGYLAEREGALDTEINWEEEASLGEKQRLAIARLVYHKPRYAILDGAFLFLSSSFFTLFWASSFVLSLSAFFFTFCGRCLLRLRRRLTSPAVAQNAQARSALRWSARCIGSAASTESHTSPYRIGLL